jgi:CRISPR/Cas system-associated exonuclease Cas4 (RecB family)
MIYEGRRRLLYKNVFEYFDADTDLYNDIDNWVDNFKHNNIIVKKGVIDTRLSICGEIDMYDKSSASIIDFKASLSSECKLEWIIQLLMYASLMKKIHKVDIKTVGIYNPLMGTYVDIDISRYNKHHELLQYMDNIRTVRMSRSSCQNIIKN